MNLASYASHPAKTRGRLYKESESESRNDYQRDRDRIIHSASFRRLQYKTQVFVNHEGDMFRSRLTHSLEVAQIARAVARTLNCHEDLCEAIALAHDLGHTPFGHAGQDALNKCMKPFGGFEHNVQSLRVIDKLEKKYASFEGLNLTFEVREGVLKHCSVKNAKTMGEIGQRFIKKTQPSLEAQIVNIADEIAYLHHDLDDGFRSGILTFELLQELDLFSNTFIKVKDLYNQLSKEQYLNEILRRMMFLVIGDLTEETQRMIKKFNPQEADDVRGMPSLVKNSQIIINHLRQIRHFSKKHLYEHPRIKKMSDQAEKTIQILFEYFVMNFDAIPESFKKEDENCEKRLIADYIAGMTDRFANDLITRIKSSS